MLTLLQAKLFVFDITSLQTNTDGRPTNLQVLKYVRWISHSESHHGTVRNHIDELPQQLR